MTPAQKAERLRQVVELEEHRRLKRAQNPVQQELDAIVASVQHAAMVHCVKRKRLNQKRAYEKATAEDRARLALKSHEAGK